MKSKITILLMFSISMYGQVQIYKIQSIENELKIRRTNSQIAIISDNKDFNGDNKNDILFEIKNCSVRGNSEHELFLSGTNNIIHMNLRINPNCDETNDVRYIKSKKGNYYNIIGYDGNTFCGTYIFAGNQILTILSFYKNRIEVVNSEYQDICYKEITNIQNTYEIAKRRKDDDLYRYQYDLLYSKLYVKDNEIMKEMKTNKSLIDKEISDSLDFIKYVNK